MDRAKRNHQALFLVLGVLLFLCSAPFSFAEQPELVKEFVFEVESPDELAYEAPEEIRENGKRYKLKKVNCELLEDNRIAVTKTVTTNNRTKYKKKLRYTTQSGALVVLTAPETISWQESGIEPVTITKDHADGNIPQKIKSTKESAEGEIPIKLELTSKEQISYRESFTAPAAFYSPQKGGTLYEFNGKIITIEGGPIWAGYEEDVLDYLGATDAVITGGTWTGRSHREGNQYVRYAQFTGTRGQALYRAVYTETDDTAYRYTAEVTYTGIDPEKKILGRAVASYEPAAEITKTILIGAGLLVLVLVIAAILFFLSKRKKRERTFRTDV